MKISRIELLRALGAMMEMSPGVPGFYESWEGETEPPDGEKKLTPYVLLEAGGGGVYAAARNRDGVFSQARLSDGVHGGAVERHVVRADRLRRILRASSDPCVHIEADAERVAEESVRVESDGLTWWLGAGPEKEGWWVFPKSRVDEALAGGVVVARKGEMHEAVCAIAEFVANNAMRYALNAVLVEIGENIRLVTTDGRALARADCEGEAITHLRGDAAEEEKTALVPPAALRCACWLMPGRLIRLAVAGDDLVLSDAGGSAFVVAGAEGRFPDYRSVVPKVERQEVVVDRKGLLWDIERLAAAAGEDVFDPDVSVRLEIGGEWLKVTRNCKIIACMRRVIGAPDSPRLTVSYGLGYMLRTLRTFRASSLALRFTADPGKDPAVVSDAESREKPRKVVVLVPKKRS